MHHPKNQTDDQRAPEDQRTVIHARGIDVGIRRPARKENPDDRVQDGDDGDGDTRSSEPEGAPEDPGFGRREPLVQHHGRGEEKRQEICGDEDGDEGLEGLARCDVDEREDHIHHGCDADAPQRETGSMIDLCVSSVKKKPSFLVWHRGEVNADLGYVAGSRDTVFTRKSPKHARCGGEDTDGREYFRGCDYGGLDRSVQNTDSLE